MAAGKIEARPYRKLGTKTFSILLSLQLEMSYLETESGLKRFLSEAKVEPTPWRPSEFGLVSSAAMAA